MSKTPVIKIKGVYKPDYCGDCVLAVMTPGYNRRVCFVTGRPLDAYSMDDVLDDCPIEEVEDSDD